LCSFVEVVYCDVIYDPLHSVSGKLLLRGAPFLAICGVLFNILSRSVFSFFRRGSLDGTVLPSGTVYKIFIFLYSYVTVQKIVYMYIPL
jgi:hypothetical protein